MHTSPGAVRLLVLSVLAAVHAGLLLPFLGALQRPLLLLFFLIVAGLLPRRRLAAASPLSRRRFSARAFSTSRLQQLLHRPFLPVLAVLDHHLAHARRRDLRRVDPLLQAPHDRGAGV